MADPPNTVKSKICWCFFFVGAITEHLKNKVAAVNGEKQKHNNPVPQHTRPPSKDKNTQHKKQKNQTHNNNNNKMKKKGNQMNIEWMPPTEWAVGTHMVRALFNLFLHSSVVHNVLIINFFFNLQSGGQ